MIGFIIIVIYIISLIGTIITYIDKDIQCNFWSLLFLLTPGLNTFVFIKYNSNKWDFLPNISSLKEYFKQLKDV